MTAAVVAAAVARHNLEGSIEDGVAALLSLGGSGAAHPIGVDATSGD